MSLRSSSCVALLIMTSAVGVGLGEAHAQSAAAKAPAPPPGADATKPPAPPPAPTGRVPWRGLTLEWISSATASILGVGKKTIGTDHQSAGMSWRLTIPYTVVDQPFWSVRLSTAPTLAVELTNSDTDTTYREPQFLDLPLRADFKLNLFSKGLWKTSTTFRSGLTFPTWKYSYGTGTILSTNQRVSVAQTFPLAGEKSPVFKSFDVSALLSWSHRFSRATTATNSNLDRPRQDFSGSSFLSDQLSTTRLAADTLQESISVAFSQDIKDMSLGLSFNFNFAQQFKPAFSSGNTCDVKIVTGCVDVTNDPNAPNKQYYYGFGTSLSFDPVPEAGIEISYSSSSSALGQSTLAPDGTRQSFFYTPYAEFGLSLIFHPDALYERLSPPKRVAKQGTKRSASKK
jgi:hypothetical protein